jgi:uncharacterized membrane protein
VVYCLYLVVLSFLAGGVLVIYCKHQEKKKEKKREKKREKSHVSY